MSKDKPLTEVNLVRWIKLVATICLLIPATPSKSESGTDELSAAQGLPAVTQSNRVLTAREAYAKWQAESRKPIILDVRTAEEFLFVGHAEMAWNVPVAAQSYIWDSATGQFPMRPLPDFVSRVEQIAKHSDTTRNVPLWRQKCSGCRIAHARWVQQCLQHLGRDGGRLSDRHQQCLPRTANGEWLEKFRASLDI